MSDSAERLRLARAAAKLGTKHRQGLRALVLFTDDDRLPDPLAAARALPKGSVVVVRSREDEKRVALAAALAPIARARRLLMLIASDMALAADADGLHLPEARLFEAAHWRALHPRLFVTASVHSFAGLGRASRLGLDAVFLSPVFPTASHLSAPSLGCVRANLMARQVCLPVYALGGITGRNAGLLSAFTGLAAIGALSA